MKRAIAMADNCIDVYYKLDRYYLTGNSIDFAFNYRDLGGELITLAGDAHRPEDFGRFFPEARAELKTLGFQYGYYFQQGRPMRYAL